MKTVKHPHAVKYALLAMLQVLAISLLVLAMKPVSADTSFIVSKKSIQDYDNAMSAVQMALEQNGFKVQFVQRVDVGLVKAGYHADKYRIVFFLPKQGMENVLSKRADLADLFPLKVTVYRDKGRVHVFSVQSARLLDASVPADVRARFQAWDRQVNGIVRNLF